jgi:hypothetical protein
VSPDCLDDIGSEWISKRMSDAEDALLRVMLELFPKLTQNGQRLLTLSLIESGQAFEPYEGLLQGKNGGTEEYLNDFLSAVMKQSSPLIVKNNDGDCWQISIFI